MRGRILVCFAPYWIGVGILRALHRKIREASAQEISGIPLHGGKTKQSKVPGKTSMPVRSTDTRIIAN